MIRRKCIVIITAILISLTLSGCELVDRSSSVLVQKVQKVEKVEGTNELTSNSRFDTVQIDPTMYVLIDKKTKIQYLKVYRNSGYDGGVDVIPLLNKSGKPFVSDKNINVKNRFVTERIDSLTLLLTDNSTNIQYLIAYRNAGYDGGISIIPLLDPEGKPYQNTEH